ncbi:Uncharacterised protein [Mycobacteroides abscessus subsp. abscessus]|nr:Uncharacterised protein [Mycobacteroides abscessus subsp. abscessus]
MLDSSASTVVFQFQFSSRAASSAVSTNSMKIAPCTGPKIFTPTSLPGSGRYLKPMPISSPSHDSASRTAKNRNLPATLRRSK